MVLSGVVLGYRLARGPGAVAGALVGLALAKPILDSQDALSASSQLPATERKTVLRASAFAALLGASPLGLLGLQPFVPAADPVVYVTVCVALSALGSALSFSSKLNRRLERQGVPLQR